MFICLYEIFKIKKKLILNQVFDEKKTFQFKLYKIFRVTLRQ